MTLYTIYFYFCNMSITKYDLKKKFIYYLLSKRNNKLSKCIESRKNSDAHILYDKLTFCQTIAGALLLEVSASHGIVMLSPSLRKYNTFGTIINFGGCWTITSIGVEGPSVPRSLNGVHVYFPPCSSLT